MTDKKVDKAAGGTILEAMVKGSKASNTAAVVEKGAPPAPVETKPKDVITEIRKEFGSRRANSRLKKAVEGAEKLGSTATPVEKVKGPVVIVGGMSLTPIATGLKPNGPSGDLYVHEGKEFYLPHQLLYNSHTRNGVDQNEPWIRITNYQGPEMSLFAFVYDNDTFYLLMDEHSTFTRDAEGYYCRTKGGQLVLINSSSYNDQFIGHNVLVNVESSENILNQSTIIVNSARVGAERGWGESGPFKSGDKRQKYAGIRLKKVDAVDSDLSRGKYYSSNFTKTSVIGTGTSENDVANTYLTECRIRAGRILVSGLTGESLDLTAEGEILLKGVGKLKHQNWNVPSIHITNRFAFTEIDHVARNDRGIKMVRISPTEVELALTMWKDGVKVAIDATRQTVEAVIRDGLRDDKDKVATVPIPNGPFGYIPPFQPLGYRSEKPGESIRNFMESYIVDQVTSRLGMIQMLDEVESCALNLSRDRNSEYVNFLD